MNLFMNKKKSLMNFSVKSLFLLALVTVGFTSCSDDAEKDNLNEQDARISVRLTDAPGDYEAVYVDVQDVRIKMDADSNPDEDDSWVSLDNVDTGIYDLLQLTGGVSQLLAEADIPAGYLHQIRLVLGTDNSVVINGESEPLSTPSAQQSGLKINVNQELEAGEHYEFLLDFDVENSIVETGNGGKILKPVIRATALANTGTIAGDIHPTTYQALVKASNGSHTISAYTSDSGEFVLHGVPAGVYKVTVTPDAASGYRVYTVNDVSVSENETTDLETLYIDGSED
jgi:hypothetical protein